jgi:hypothetical protein
MVVSQLQQRLKRVCEVNHTMPDGMFMLGQISPPQAKAEANLVWGIFLPIRNWNKWDAHNLILSFSDFQLCFMMND